MVIACPNCQRKYQIDTTRIPPGGTTFTCWTCRASVPVGAMGGSTNGSGARSEVESQPPPQPAGPAIPRSSEAPSQKPDMPDTARRFFESLAAERIHQRKPTGPIVAPPQTVAPPVSPAPFSELGPDVASATISSVPARPVATAPPLREVSQHEFQTARSVPPAPKPVDTTPPPGFNAPPPSGPLPPLPGRASGPLPPVAGRSTGALSRPSGSGPLVTRVATPLPDEPIDVFGGEDARTTARLTPRSSPSDNILDLNLFATAPTAAPSEPASVREEPTTTPEPSTPSTTLVMSSVTETPTTSAPGQKAPNGHAKDVGAGVTLPIRVPEAAAELVRENVASTHAEPTADLPIDPPSNAVPLVPSVEERELPRPPSRPRLVLPNPLPAASDAVAESVHDVDETAALPPLPAPQPVQAVSEARDRAAAVSPAAVAANYVAPSVETARRKRKFSFGIPVMPIVAILTVALCGYVLWSQLFKGRSRPQPTRPAAASSAADAAPATTSPAPTIGAKNGATAAVTPEPIPQQTPPVTTTPPPRPSGSDARTGGFALQVQSAKAESESQATVGRLIAGGAEAYLTRADLGARGVWYRVRVGHFESRADAQAAGAKLVSSGKISTFIIVPYEPAL
jgi:hypothetical protein